ncbi:MAG: hypothetical protein E6G06_18155 [Actinobacteria bacterium]|nr:MAG: hypothetical protein E6G06_18155 [Actinomycetota bacterium]
MEYALLLAMVALIVFGTVYALGRSPDRPSSVLGQTFNNPPAGGGPGPTPPSSTPTSTTTTTTTTPLPPQP